ncbi:M20 family peptidase [Phenylobacterium sp. J367]|uniref:M20 family peptidase n=1 Tax=Phenylobacterium sp. J367 TaxID=2898435 RepID=UPI00215165ED|nr:M20 family peptidase [Phenylobacterium sp. J367]MCR5878435.1 M20 family peptidase [Phenylobacterium sp. J367]
MRLAGKIALAVFAGLILLVAVVLVRTLTYKPAAVADGRDVRVAPPVAVDVDRAAQRLSAAVRIQTVSHQDRAEDQPAEWARLHAFLAEAYPAAHAAMRRELVAERTLVFTWPGSDAALAPIVLMAHQDVVPVTPGTEGDWKHPPFGGVIAEGAVWGRGAIDDKGSLITLFEGLETLAAGGFQPRRTVIVVSGHDEEVRGGGARAAAALLKSRGIRAQFVLDEGLAVIDGNPLTGGRLALVGTAEKGFATLKVTAEAKGGHSSAPPKDGGGVLTLARAVAAIADRPFPMRLDGPAGDMMATAAPHAPFVVRMAVANRWLFGPLLKSQLGATPAGAALMHTTIAPTMLKGSPKENVLPQDATAWINYRIAPGDSSAEVMARARAAVGDLPVTLAWNRPPDEPSPVSSTTSDAWKVIAAVAGETARAPVAPGLVTAATDSRYMQPVAKDVYRFQPMALTVETTGMIHGTNEHLTLENLGMAVQFYARLVATAASR